MLQYAVHRPPSPKMCLIYLQPYSTFEIYVPQGYVRSALIGGIVAQLGPSVPRVKSVIWSTRGIHRLSMLGIKHLRNIY